MIFKRTGSLAEVMMLIPIVNEWSMVYPDMRVSVETRFPEVFKGNPNVKQSAIYIDNDEEQVINFDEVDDYVLQAHLIDLYANRLFNDVRLHDRRFKLFPEEKEKSHIDELLESRHCTKKIAVCCFSNNKWCDIDSKVAQGVMENLSKDYDVVCVAGIDGLSLHEIYWLIQKADLYVGLDNDVSYIAMATDTPMVMAFSCRNPRYRFPFRQGIPFETLFSSLVCEEAEFCLKENGSYEPGIFHYIVCPMSEKLKCMSYLTENHFEGAVKRVEQCMSKL